MKSISVGRNAMGFGLARGLLAAALGFALAGCSSGIRSDGGAGGQTSGSDSTSAAGNTSNSGAGAGAGASGTSADVGGRTSPATGGVVTGGSTGASAGKAGSGGSVATSTGGQGGSASATSMVSGGSKGGNNTGDSATTGGKGGTASSSTGGSSVAGASASSASTGGTLAQSSGVFDAGAAVDAGSGPTDFTRLIGKYKVSTQGGGLSCGTYGAAIQFKDEGMTVVRGSDSDLLATTNPLPGEYPAACAVKINAVDSPESGMLQAPQDAVCTSGGVTMTLAAYVFSNGSVTGTKVVISANGKVTGGPHSSCNFSYSAEALLEP